MDGTPERNAGGGGGSGSGSVTKLRRNGKQQSCEPCRLRKQSCSHQSPCARCIRHKRNCVYVDAPMSRQRKAEDGSPLPTPAPSYASVTSSPKPVVRRPSASLRKASTQDNPLTLETGGSIGYRRTPAGMSMGYVGSTGFSAILDEAKNHLGMNIWEDPDATSETQAWEVRPDGSSPGRAICRKILAWLPSPQIMYKVRRYAQGEWTCTSAQLPSIEAWHSKFWDAYGSILEEPRNEDAIDAMADELVRNTRRPLPTHPKTNAEWQAAYSGRKSRWELVGELFVLAGNMAALAPESSPVLQEMLGASFKNKKKNFAYSMLECADACLMLCDELDISSNFHVAGLLGKCVTLQSVIMGDSGYELWKRCGQLANACTGLGIHRRLENLDDIAPLFAEERIRTFVTAYLTTTGIAVFVGRPPPLSQRYITAPLPLDVPETAILDAKRLSDVIPLTRADGWNREGKITRATMLRLFMINALFRDEILEISLGHPEYRGSGERIRDLRSRIDASRKDLPPAFCLTLDKQDFAQRSTQELSTAVSTRLNYLHLEFLIERIDYEGRDERRLVRVAQEMLKTVVVYWTERDRFPDNRDEVHWFISFAGIPAASALAIDLFKQTIAPYAKPYDSQRPEIIQDLSLFIACLDWVRPEDGNYVLCGRVQKMIRHILDRVLMPNASVQQAPEPEYSGYNLNELSIDNLPQYGIEFTGWLDGIETMQDWSFDRQNAPVWQ